MDDFSSESELLSPVDDGLKMRGAGRWAKDKLDVLARYIHTSTIAMSSQKNFWRSRFYIDLQAGPGKNYVKNSQGDIFFGSPLLALTEGAGYTHYRFVENNPSLVNALMRRCEATESSLRRKIQILAGDCNEIVDQIVDEIDQIDQPPYSRADWNSLSLAFLDPEGLELHWETVLKLASLKRTDLIINFCIGGLRRVAHQARSLPSGQAEADKFFGTAEWRDIPFRPDGLMPGHKWIEFYKKRLTEVSDPPYQWGTDISVKNSRGVELYRLLFASKSSFGITLWEDARTKGPGQLALF